MQTYREQLFQSDRLCYWCGDAIHDLDDATLDHIHPRALGGGNCRDNLALCCKPCNQAKGMRAVCTMSIPNISIIKGVIGWLRSTGRETTVSNILWFARDRYPRKIGEGWVHEYLRRFGAVTTGKNPSRVKYYTSYHPFKDPLFKDMQGGL